MLSKFFAVNMNNSCLPQKVTPAINRKLNKSYKTDQKQPIVQHNIPSAFINHCYRRTLPDPTRHLLPDPGARYQTPPDAASGTAARYQTPAHATRPHPTLKNHNPNATIPDSFSVITPSATLGMYRGIRLKLGPHSLGGLDGFEELVFNAMASAGIAHLLEHLLKDLLVCAQTPV